MTSYRESEAPAKSEAPMFSLTRPFKLFAQWVGRLIWRWVTSEVMTSYWSDMTHRNEPFPTSFGFAVGVLCCATIIATIGTFTTGWGLWFVLTSGAMVVARAFLRGALHIDNAESRARWERVLGL